MARVLSPGQKKKRIIMWVILTLFVICTFIAMNIVKRLTSTAYQWVDSHESVMAVVDETYQTEEEYTTRKGRRRERTHYWLEYSFSVGGSAFSNEVEIGSSEFDKVSEGEPIEVWYSPGDPTISDTAENIDHEMNSNDLLGNFISVAPYSFGVFFFLYRILVYLFARESKNVLPEGFYGQRSWLDVDDKVMVVADGRTVVYFEIHKNQVNETQEAYQSGKSLDELIRISRATEVHRVPMAEITSMKSDHNTDTIELEHDDEKHSVEFLNIALKKHALRRFQLMMPESMAYQKVERTRLQAVLPSFIALLVLAGIIWFVGIFAIQLLLSAVALLWVVPKFIRELINPTQSESWSVPEEPGAAGAAA